MRIIKFFILFVMFFFIYPNISIAENIIETETNAYLIKSLCTKQKNKINIKIESVEKRTKNKTVREYLIRAREIIKLTTFNNKIIVRGALKAGGDLFIIISFPSLELIDTIWGYNASVSSDNKYLVYIKHYPRSYSSNAFSRDILMLYNLELTPRQNRIQIQEKLDPRECGTPLYPRFDKENQGKNTYSSIVYEKANLYSITSGITWIDESNILFTNFENNSNYVIIVDLNNKAILKKQLPERYQNKFTAKQIKRKEFAVITMFNGFEFVVDVENAELDKKLKIFYREGQQQ